MAREQAPLSGRQIAETALGRLLDRVEGRAERQNRVIEPLPKVSLLYDDREELYAILRRAEADGAIEIKSGRLENQHNIEKVILLDPEPLYRLLGRSKPSEVAAAARAALEERLPDLAPGLKEALDRVVAGWAGKRNLVRDLGPDDLDDAVGVFRAAAALVGRSRDDGMDMRTFSRRATGNSKFVEGNAGKIADVIRMVKPDLPGYLDAFEVLAQHGVRRFPHACLIAGPVAYKGIALPTEPYIGVAPEMTHHLGVTAEPEWMLTIENLASFNRQVREAAQCGLIVYTGGFPSEATLAAILALARATRCPVFHWGDIDPGGIKIAYRIERALADEGRRLDLHLMSPEIASRHGSPSKPTLVFKDFDETDSALTDLVDFMRSDQAHQLEQEELDPTPPLQTIVRSEELC